MSWYKYDPWPFTCVFWKMKKVCIFQQTAALLLGSGPGPEDLEAGSNLVFKYLFQPCSVKKIRTEIKMSKRVCIGFSKARWIIMIHIRTSSVDYGLRPETTDHSGHTWPHSGDTGHWSIGMETQATGHWSIGDTTWNIPTIQEKLISCRYCCWCVCDWKMI